MGWNGQRPCGSAVFVWFTQQLTVLVRVPCLPQLFSRFFRPSKRHAARWTIQWRKCCRQGKGRQGKERQGKGRRGKARRGKARRGKRRTSLDHHHAPMTMVHQRWQTSLEPVLGRVFFPGWTLFQHRPLVHHHQSHCQPLAFAATGLATHGTLVLLVCASKASRKVCCVLCALCVLCWRKNSKNQQQQNAHNYYLFSSLFLFLSLALTQSHRHTQSLTPSHTHTHTITHTCTLNHSPVNGSGSFCQDQLNWGQCEKQTNKQTNKKKKKRQNTTQSQQRKERDERDRRKGSDKGEETQAKHRHTHMCVCVWSLCAST